MLRDDTKSGTVEGVVQWQCDILARRGISWVTGQTPRYSLAAVDEAEAFVEEIKRRRSGKNKPTGRRYFFECSDPFKSLSNLLGSSTARNVQAAHDRHHLPQYHHCSDNNYRFCCSNFSWVTGRSDWIFNDLPQVIQSNVRKLPEIR